MKGLKILLFIAAGCLVAGSLYADIYEWTDENGVRHFTNHAPPDGATIVMKSKELPHDKLDDHTPVEAERQQQLELTKLELAEKETELKRQQAEVQLKVAEAERYAAETVKAADQYLDDTRNGIYYYRIGGYYGYYPRPLYRRRNLLKYTAGICLVNPPYIGHYKLNYPGKSHYGHSRKNFSHKDHPRKHPPPHSLRSRSQRAHDAYRVKFLVRDQWERSPSKMAFYGFPR